MSLQVASTAKESSFADDACGTSSKTEIKRWWDMLITLDPDFGYFSSGKKWWIITKLDKEESDIRITMEGKNHLRAAISSREYLEEYVSEKVLIWLVK